MRNFRKFNVYQSAMELVFGVYDVSKSLPIEEKYGIKSQITRCAVSVPSNIAEGAGRESTKEFLRFLNIALSSLYELETQLLIIKEKILHQKTEQENLSKLIEDCISLQKRLSSFSASVKLNG